jgi:very-short-patch-repair endonuclease
MDRKVASPDHAIAGIAERQHGMVAASQLRLLGIGEGAIRARLNSGRLHVVHRGVYAVGHSALSMEARCIGAVLAVGGGPAGGHESVLGRWNAAVSHRSAASLWGLLPPKKEGPIHVLAQGQGGKSRRRGICIHRPRSLMPTDVTLRLGIPITTPARTISDLRTAISLGRSGAISPRELRRAIRQANVLGLQIGEECGRDRTRSDLERDFLRLCRQHRLPSPEVNVRIGKYLVDFLWRDQWLVVETDSYLYHRGQVAFQDDRDRDLELKRLGYEVLRVSERQLNEEPRRVAETVAAVLKRRGRTRPRHAR